MRNKMITIICAGLIVAGCETVDGDGYLTHSDHSLTPAERGAVQTAMQNYLKVPVTVSGLRSSYNLANGSVTVCGYISGQVGGKTTPPSLFAGTLSSPGASHFTPLRVPGKGQDPQRIATVRAFCQAEQVSI